MKTKQDIREAITSFECSGGSITIEDFAQQISGWQVEAWSEGWRDGSKAVASSRTYRIAPTLTQDGVEISGTDLTLSESERATDNPETNGVGYGEDSGTLPPIRNLLKIRVEG